MCVSNLDEKINISNVTPKHVTRIDHLVSCTQVISSVQTQYGTHRGINRTIPSTYTHKNIQCTYTVHIRYSYRQYNTKEL